MTAFRSSLLAWACALIAAPALAQVQASGAFDSNYVINAPASLRPLHIFNDGVSTFIEPRKGQKLAILGATENGPYLVVSGVPDEIRISGYVASHVDDQGRPLAKPGASPSPAPVPAPNSPLQSLWERAAAAEKPGKAGGPAMTETGPQASTAEIPEKAKAEPRPVRSLVRMDLPVGADLADLLPKWAKLHGLDLAWEIDAPWHAKVATAVSASTTMSVIDGVMALHGLQAVMVAGTNRLAVLGVDEMSQSQESASHPARNVRRKRK